MDSILIIDDDVFQRDTLATLFSRRLHMPSVLAENGKEGLAILASDQAHTIKLVILDLNMPVMGGMETLVILHEQNPDLPVIMLTGSNELETAVQAMRHGAVDFVSKPWQGDRIVVTVQNALKFSALNQEVSRLRRKEKGELIFQDLVGHDGGLAGCVHAGRKAAASNISVLITGETGVGKEMFAHAIHGESLRAGKPFIAVNCGAIPPNLIESTLFGHEKGAFTGAIARVPGKFREAEGGTIFLDEVGELPLEAQTRLLRVLQQKEVEPVGSAKPIPVDVRIISATHKNLQEEVRSGNFREDLLFRLDVLRIDLPSLRARPQDIIGLANFFLRRLSAEGKSPRVLSKEAAALLERYSWPGNVRELENALYRAIVLAEKPILTPEDFEFLQEGRHEMPSVTQNSYKIDIREKENFKTMEQIEAEVIHLLLGYYKGNVSQVAKTLGIPKSTFYRRLQKDEINNN